MSLPPITIPELDPAGPVDAASDQLLIRQGLNDRRITVDNLFSFQLATYATLPNEIMQTDVILIGRNNGSGYTNYITAPTKLGFLKGVIMWFYADTAPINWSIVSSLTDRVLAVKGGSQAYTNQGRQGTWTQANHTLTISEIPSHTHQFQIYTSDEKGNLVPGKVSSTARNTNQTLTTTATGGGGGHNHGNTWRPAAAVGIVCQKTG